MATTVTNQQMSQVARALITYLKKNNQLEMLPQLIREARKETNAYTDENTAYVESAVVLTKEEEQAIAETLKKNLARDIAIKTSVNPALIGGFKVRIADKVVDYSIAHSINQLQEILAV